MIGQFFLFCNAFHVILHSRDWVVKIQNRIPDGNEPNNRFERYKESGCNDFALNEAKKHLKNTIYAF